MARDKHPRERQAQKLARKKGSRPPYPRLLIVTEGGRTEPLYFEEIRQQGRVASAHVVITPSDYGTAPRQIVDFAKDEFARREKEFDRVFAVFDRDEHPSYHEAIQTCLRARLRNDERKSVEIEAVCSNPCFELWLLLHFEDIRDLFHREEIMRKLKRHMPDYEKALEGAFRRTRPKLQDAVDRAKRLRSLIGPEDDRGGPYTNVDTVVELLLSLRRSG